MKSPREAVRTGSAITWNLFETRIASSETPRGGQRLDYHASHARASQGIGSTGVRIVRASRAPTDAECALPSRRPSALVATYLGPVHGQEGEEWARPVARFGTPEKLGNAAPAEIEAIVRPTGFYRQKAKSIQSAARELVARHGGAVPKTMEELTALRGVARKTANVVLGNAYGVPGLTIDTHMARVNQRLALTRHEDPVKIERDLMALVPEAEWTLYSHRVIHHGRVCCSARKPKCDACPLLRECPGRRPSSGRGAVSASA